MAIGKLWLETRRPGLLAKMIVSRSRVGRRSVAAERLRPVVVAHAPAPASVFFFGTAPNGRVRWRTPDSRFSYIFMVCVLIDSEA